MMWSLPSPLLRNQVRALPTTELQLVFSWIFSLENQFGFCRLMRMPSALENGQNFQNDF
jgi:hypothetical protein